jgi:hypothetical protein
MAERSVDAGSLVEKAMKYDAFSTRPSVMAP